MALRQDDNDMKVDPENGIYVEMEGIMEWRYSVLNSTLSQAEFKEFEPRLDAVQTWLVPFEIIISVSRFEPVRNLNRFIGSSATRFKFFKFSLIKHIM